MSSEYIENARTALLSELDQAQTLRTGHQKNVDYYIGEVAKVDGDIRRITEAVAMLADGEENLLTDAEILGDILPPAPEPEARPEPLPADATTGDYMRAVLRANPTEEFTAATMVEAMYERGWKTTSANPKQLVRSNITNLVYSGHALRFGEYGSGRFGYKERQPLASKKASKK